jgi:hypothetical protein
LFVVGSRLQAWGLGDCEGFNGDLCGYCDSQRHIDGTISVQYAGCFGGTCVSSCDSWCQSQGCLFYYDNCSDQSEYIDGECGCSNCQ